VKNSAKLIAVSRNILELRPSVRPQCSLQVVNLTECLTLCEQKDKSKTKQFILFSEFGIFFVPLHPQTIKIMIINRTKEIKTMKKKNLWMLAAILTCGLGMTLTSCSVSDNSDNVVIVDPTPGDDSYTIEVEPGLTLPENEFNTWVPTTTDFDQNIVDALKSVDKVIDVKPFTMVHMYNRSTKQFFTKTAYFFNYKQLIDHNDASKGWFKQQCVLTVAGKDRPTVLLTEGYALGSAQNYKNRLDSIFEPALVSTLEANCLQVEHRYFGWSLPEGFTNKWNYLTAKQNSADLHTIVTAIKQSGIVGQGKWLATGVSKPGMTAAYYAYEYPGEMDAYVPFCAPFMLSQAETEAYDYILSAAALGDRLEKVKAAFRAYCGNKTLQQETAKLLKKNYPAYSGYDDDAARIMALRLLFDHHWGKMSYVHYSLWEPMVPKEGDSAEKFLTYIMADENTRYEGEDAVDYQNRLDNVNDLEPTGSDNLVRGMTRAGEKKERMDPFYAHTFIELGATVTTISWVEDLLSEDEKAILTTPNNPALYGFKYDNGDYIRKVLDGIKQSDVNMMFVYGMQDPWTGNRIPDDKLGKNCQILYIQNGTHNDAIDTWNFSERNALYHWLAELGFDL